MACVDEQNKEKNLCYSVKITLVSVLSYSGCAPSRAWSVDEHPFPCSKLIQTKTDSYPVLRIYFPHKLKLNTLAML